MLWLGIFIGLLLGAPFGVLVLSWMTAAKRADEQMEEEIRRGSEAGDTISREYQEAETSWSDYRKQGGSVPEHPRDQKNGYRP
jgi:hypothetical protein